MNIKQTIYKKEENNYLNHFVNYKRNLDHVPCLNNTTNKLNLNNISLIDKIKISKCFEVKINKKDKFLYSNKISDSKIFQLRNLSRDNINDKMDLLNNPSKRIPPTTKIKSIKKKILALSEQKIPVINNKTKNENTFLNTRNSNNKMVKYNRNNLYLNNKLTFRENGFNCLKNLILSDAKFNKNICNKKKILTKKDNFNYLSNISFFNKYPRIDLLIGEHKKKHDINNNLEHVSRKSHCDKLNFSTSKNNYNEEEIDKLISMIKGKVRDYFIGKFNNTMEYFNDWDANKRKILSIENIYDYLTKKIKIQMTKSDIKYIFCQKSIYCFDYDNFKYFFFDDPILYNLSKFEDENDKNQNQNHQKLSDNNDNKIKMIKSSSDINISVNKKDNKTKNRTNNSNKIKIEKHETNFNSTINRAEEVNQNMGNIIKIKSFKNPLNDLYFQKNKNEKKNLIIDKINENNEIHKNKLKLKLNIKNNTKNSTRVILYSEKNLKNNYKNNNTKTNNNNDNIGKNDNDKYIIDNNLNKSENTTKYSNIITKSEKFSKFYDLTFYKELKRQPYFNNKIISNELFTQIAEDTAKNKEKNSDIINIL